MAVCLTKKGKNILKITMFTYLPFHRFYSYIIYRFLVLTVYLKSLSGKFNCFWIILQLSQDIFATPLTLNQF